MNQPASALHTNHRSYEEKRDFIRMEINAEATITDIHGEPCAGRCLNLSGSGALLELDNNLAVNDPIGLVIHSPYGHSPVLNVTGRVIRGQAAEHSSGKFLVAMCYAR